MATGAQLRLVHGRGAADRVGGRPAERSHRAVLRRALRRGPGRRPPATDRRGRGLRRGRRLVRARHQRALLRRLRRGRARAVHTQRRLLPAAGLFRGRSGRADRPHGRHRRRWPTARVAGRRRVRAVRRHGGHVRPAHRAQEPGLARRGVPVPVRHSREPGQM